jgi:hypothetical protein
MRHRRAVAIFYASPRRKATLNALTAHRRQKRLRAVLLVFAGLLAAQSTWIILPELIRPIPRTSPSETQNPAIGSSERDRAHWAAELAIIRGDLWTEDAIAQSSELIRDGELRKVVQSADQVQVARATAEEAASLSPHDARAWLLLASLDCLLHRDAAGALKMSYYTGANEIALIPMRLLVATCSDTINDDEVQDILAREIRLIITREQNLKPAIQAAYQKASPAGQRLIETVVGDLDSGLMTTIRSSGKLR